MDEKERQENINDMKNPGCWPHYPVLPIKRRENSSKGREKLEAAFLLATGEPIVYLLNMWSIGELGCKNLKDVQEKVKSIKYSSFEAMIDDEWEVD